ncbi:MAG: putative sulfate exporter family transporter [Holophagaceae bacterium]|nr:putative sulfate exporter family transporter [Holophagaceae bacterium]
MPALALLCLLPVVPSWGALAVGLLLALVLGNPYAARTKALTPKLLSLSVMGLGAGMNLVQVAKAGLAGFAYTAAGLGLALGLGWILGRLMKVQRDTSVLLSVGTAICGGSAIAAVAPVIRASDEEVSMALVTVFLLNAAALVLFPLIGHALHMGERPFGLWAALAIHDTSSVVGAASGYGPEALLVATTTKLARALWIVPVAYGIGLLYTRLQYFSGEAGDAKAKRPWFILGFLAMAALVTFVPALQPAGAWVNAAAKRLLVLTLFLLGCGLSREALKRVGPRPLFQGMLLWLCVGAGSLGAIRLGWIR